MAGDDDASVKNEGIGARNGSSFHSLASFLFSFIFFFSEVLRLLSALNCTKSGRKWTTLRTDIYAYILLPYFLLHHCNLEEIVHPT
jgi:hypothetical protein